MSSHAYAYVVTKHQRRPLKLTHNGQVFRTGDVIRDTDAADLEQPENAHLLAMCTRVSDDAFKHHDVARAAAAAAASAESEAAKADAPAPKPAASPLPTVSFAPAPAASPNAGE